MSALIEFTTEQLAQELERRKTEAAEKARQEIIAHNTELLKALSKGLLDLIPHDLTSCDKYDNGWITYRPEALRPSPRCWKCALQESIATGHVPDEVKIRVRIDRY